MDGIKFYNGYNSYKWDTYHNVASNYRVIQLIAINLLRVIKWSRVLLLTSSEQLSLNINFDASVRYTAVQRSPAHNAFSKTLSPTVKHSISTNIVYVEFSLPCHASRMYSENNVPKKLLICI